MDRSQGRQVPGRLYVVGSANMDLVVRAPRLPVAGETVVGSDLVQIPGGKGANQAVAAARLGAAVSFVGCVGADSFGDHLRQAMAADGIALANLGTLADRPSGVALIVVDAGGENLIAVGAGANAALTADQVEVALSAMRPEDVLLVQLEVPFEAVEHACRRARQRGARTVVNAAPADRRGLSLLALTTVLIVNAGEAATLTETEPSATSTAPSVTHGDKTLVPLTDTEPPTSGTARSVTGASGTLFPLIDTGPRNLETLPIDSAAYEAAALELLGLGPEVVIVTLGGEGLLLATTEGARRIAAHSVEVVDTTAAGDAFCGAFAAGLLEGQPVDAAAQFASVAAALSTTRLGAQSSLPSRAEVDAHQATISQP